MRSVLGVCTVKALYRLISCLPHSLGLSKFGRGLTSLKVYNNRRPYTKTKANLKNTYFVWFLILFPIFLVNYVDYYSTFKPHNLVLKTFFEKIYRLFQQPHLYHWFNFFIIVKVFTTQVTLLEPKKRGLLFSFRCWFNIYVPSLP